MRFHFRTTAQLSCVHLHSRFVHEDLENDKQLVMLDKKMCCVVLYGECGVCFLVLETLVFNDTWEAILFS